MGGYTPIARSSPTVHVVNPYGGRTTVRGVNSERPTTGSRLKAWIVRSIMLATTGFALLDLFLLGTGGHH
jgi:hypothetical protein